MNEPVNKITLIVKGKPIDYPLPAFGEIKITMANDDVKFIETTTREKLD